MNTEKHFTATVFVVHNSKVLMHIHKKFGVWLPVGGHLEPNEIPEKAVLREAKEESGLDIKLYNHEKTKFGFSDAVQLINPVHMLLEDINMPNHKHQHIDFIYYATSDTDKLSPISGESNEFKWFTKDEIISEENIFDNVKPMALEALKILS